jgi:hypothetical protein
MKPLEQRRNYSSVVSALARIAREEGLAALYSGLAPNILRGMSMNMGMMACYDEVRASVCCAVMCCAVLCPVLCCVYCAVCTVLCYAVLLCCDFLCCSTVLSCPVWS